MIKAVLFDMDGLLADTETLAMSVAVKICRGLDFELTSREQKSFIGVTDEKFYRELFLKKGLKLDLDKILKQHFEIYDKLLENNFRPFPGADILPKQLKEQGYKLALVSGSTEKQIDIILGQLGTKGYFDTIISANQITHSKPNPEGFL